LACPLACLASHEEASHEEASHEEASLAEAEATQVALVAPDEEEAASVGPVVVVNLIKLAILVVQVIQVAHPNWQLGPLQSPGKTV